MGVSLWIKNISLTFIAVSRWIKNVSLQFMGVSLWVKNVSPRFMGVSLWIKILFLRFKNVCLSFRGVSFWVRDVCRKNFDLCLNHFSTFIYELEIYRIHSFLKRNHPGADLSISFKSLLCIIGGLTDKMLSLIHI